MLRARCWGCEGGWGALWGAWVGGRMWLGACCMLSGRLLKLAALSAPP